MEEGLEILKLAWTQDKASYRGRRYSFDNVEVQPKPLQEPHPPLWYGARSVAGARRAARHRCHLAPIAIDPDMLRVYHQTLEEMGEDPARYHVSGGASIIVTYEDPQRVWERVRPHAIYRWRLYDEMIADAGDPELRPRAAQTAQREYRGNEVIGDPETILRIIEKVREGRSWKGKKFDEMILASLPPGLPIKECMSSYELFAKEVLPVLKKW
jgi:alkanesulfonate monooxygenase SsuD/methylene tetrahydromethanopterin reductase-like flavin-dependent oxidoreductase (luciferase family)